MAAVRGRPLYGKLKSGCQWRDLAGWRRSGPGDLDFGALSQGRRRQSSFHRSFSAKLCKVRRPPNPTK